MIIELTPYGMQHAEMLKQQLSELGMRVHVVPGKPLIILDSNPDAGTLESFSQSIHKATAVETPYQLAGKSYKTETRFEVNGNRIGRGLFSMIAGPCSIESEEQIFSTAQLLSKLGIRFIRGGAFKPRTSPYSFRGLGLDGLKMMHEAAKQYQLTVVSELMDLQLLDKVAPYVDIIQVGSRNMQNFYMLNELGKQSKPVMLKRGMSARVKEWLLAAEYILSGGNEKVLLCERGIRSFDPESRNVMDLGVISLMKELSHLPVIADPSHGTGKSAQVTPMALAAVMAGADGVMVEIHPEPSTALSDSLQALNFEQFGDLIGRLNPLLAHRQEMERNAEGVLKLQSLS